jgi:hypothetical protein
MAIKKRVYIVITIISLVLYLAGVASGIFISNYFMSKTSQEVKTLSETIENIKVDTENFQLEQLYLSSIGKEGSCKFLVSSIDELEKELRFFWDRLPKRLEEFEKYGQVTEEYNKLKRDYTFALLRTWMFSYTLREQCDKNIVPILYFYSKSCEECLNQGIELDNYKVYSASIGKRVFVFTVDLDIGEPIVTIIKNTYNITETPSLIVNKDVYKGFMSTEELKKISV